jgi:chromosome segregation ATPase
MRRRQAIEADELFEVANRLQAEGKEVTALTLLDALGGGSLRTIYKYLEVWKDRRPQVVISGNEEMPDNVRAVFANAWRAATQEAGREVLAVREQAAGEVKEALKQFEGALEAIGKLDDDNNAASLLIDELKAQLAEAQQEAHRAREEGAGHKAAAEQLTRQVEKQEKDLERLRAEIEKERERHQEAEHETSGRIALLKENEKTLLITEGKLKEELRGWRDIREKIAKECEKAQEESRVNKAEREAATTEAAELRGQIEALKQQNKELLDRLGERPQN